MPPWSGPITARTQGHIQGDAANAFAEHSTPLQSPRLLNSPLHQWCFTAYACLCQPRNEAVGFYPQPPSDVSCQNYQSFQKLQTRTLDTAVLLQEGSMTVHEGGASKKGEGGGGFEGEEGGRGGPPPSPPSKPSLLSPPSNASSPPLRTPPPPFPPSNPPPSPLFFLCV